MLIDQGSIKDLQTLLPILIDHIFGPQGTMSWDLRNTSVSTNAQDFQTLQHFLSSTGSLFKLIYILLKDPLIKYEFSLAYLPVS